MTIDSPDSGRSPFQRSQKRAPTSATGAAPRCSSPARNPRPRAGRVPMTSRNPCETIATGTDCGSPAPRTVCRDAVVSAIAAKPRVCACQSRKLGSDTLAPRLPVSPIWNSCTMRSASGYGSGRSSTPSTTVNIAAAAPMPSPMVRIAVSENDGTRASERPAIRRSRLRSRSQAPRSSSAVASRACTTPPNFRRAARRASSGDMPAAMCFAVCCSMWKAISSAMRSSRRAMPALLRLRWRAAPGRWRAKAGATTRARARRAGGRPRSACSSARGGCWR